MIGDIEQAKIPDQEMSPIKVTVGVPTYGATPAICQLSFGSFIGAGVGSGHIHHLNQVEGAYIDRARNNLVQMARANECTHLCFLDQDMIVPEGALQRMLQHELPVVGAIYFGKDDWATPVAYHLDPFARVYEMDDCPKIPSTAGLPTTAAGDELTCVCGDITDHIHLVGGTGMGCILIEMSVFDKMEAEFDDQLWFSSRDTGEDVHFAMRCKKLGISFYMDAFIQCGHVRTAVVTRGNYDFAREHAPECGVEGCTRAGIFKNGDNDRCWKHHKEDDPTAWYLEEV